MTGLYQDTLIEELLHGVRPLLHRWELSADSGLSLLCISENATFRADDPGRDRPVVLRVHRPGYHGYDEIVSELAWIEDLRANRVVETPRPLADSEGGLVASFRHRGELRHVVAFEFMSGAEPDESSDLRDRFRQLGRITARLHQHAKGWQKPPGFNRKTWNFETMLGSRPHWGDWRDALGLDANGENLLADCVSQLSRQLDEYGTGPERFGLIHADLRLTNLLADGGRLAVIDFDDCGFGWYLYDLAAAVSFIETSPQIPSLQRAWVQGYREVAPLSPRDESAIPMFIMLRRLLLTAWIASHAETPTARELGSGYTDDTVRLARDYLQHYGQTSSQGP